MIGHLFMWSVAISVSFRKGQIPFPGLIVLFDIEL